MTNKTAILCFILLFLSGTTGYGEERIRLTNGEWAPYTSESMPGGGIMSQIVTEAFALTGITVEYIYLASWKRAYVLAAKGRYDGSLTWAKTGEREKDFYFSDPVMEHDNVLFHLASSPLVWQEPADLKHLRISVTNAYFYGRKFHQALDAKTLNVFVVYEDIVNFHNLFEGRIDAFPMDKNVGYHLLHTAFSEEKQGLVSHHPRLLSRFPTGLVISRRIDKTRALRLLKTFNAGLATLKANGRYSALISEFPR